ncbi:DUF6939 family protein [Nonomuraea aridisoli]|uniref:DUF6939 family protein n=1 Tax=Nonomuraea aridisoli TaxID=2070368 RepID=UPI003F695CE0
MREAAGEADVLVVAVRAQPLVAFLAVFRAQCLFVDSGHASLRARGGSLAAISECHSEFPSDKSPVSVGVHRHHGRRAHPPRRPLPYEEARRRVYLPAYHWVLAHKAADVVERLREVARGQEVVLLDYTTNGDVSDLTTPLSHATLVRLHLLGERLSHYCGGPS